jgi:hypothetical protein
MGIYDLRFMTDDLTAVEAQIQPKIMNRESSIKSESRVAASVARPVEAVIGSSLPAPRTKKALDIRRQSDKFPAPYEM